MAQRRAFAAAVLACLLAGGTASAQNFIQCSGPGPNFRISVRPILKVKPLQELNPGADCAMWQTFFYLNWPALTGKTGGRGVPNKNARFGAPGPTVWETYRRVEEVFLPLGRKPASWDASFLHSDLSPDMAAEVDTGQARLLFRKSKISRQVIDVIAPFFAGDAVLLQYIEQADKNILYDQEKQPVYYEIAMDRVQFNYIVDHGLYNADTQKAFASKANIILPLGAIELKAAWKILTPGEVSSGRFHAVKAYIRGQSQPVTVGLVGLHVFTSGADKTIGMWGTFAQVDNVPVYNEVVKGHYNFYNPSCSETQCPINDPATVPTQAVQMLADNAEAASISENVRNMIQQYDSKTPWQYYKLINVLWSPHGIKLNTPVPINVALPSAAPTSASTLVNPVIETFVQRTDTNCLSCHVYAPIANPHHTTPPPSTAAGYSFMFSNAQAP